MQHGGKMKTGHGRLLVLCMPIWALQSQVRLTKLSSLHDDDECVLAAGLFLALKMRRMLRFRTTWHRQRYHIPPSWMVNECSRWLHALSLHYYWTCPFESVSLYLSGHFQEISRLQRNWDTTFPEAGKARTWKEEGKKMKSERQRCFLTLSVSHSAREHTLQTQVCWSPLKKFEGRQRSQSFAVKE